MKTLKILGLDYETQGFPADKTNATEVGAILVELKVHEDVEGKLLNGLPTRTELARYNALIYAPDYPPQTREIVDLTGITDAALKAEGVLPAVAHGEVLKLMEQADIVMTHNVAFDQGVFLTQHRRALGEALLPEVKWFCSLKDIQYPKKFSCKKLGHLALDHGVKMDHRNLHRATDDVELMLDLVLGNYHIIDLLDYHNEPKVKVQIWTPGPWTDGGKGRDHATAQGYSWDGKLKAWTKDILQKNFNVEQENGKPYRVSIMS
jgi:DNA polymerase III epsilon subunit-like protein